MIADGGESEGLEILKTSMSNQPRIDLLKNGNK